MDLPKAIETLLEKRKKRKIWLAERVGVTRQYITAICNGSNTPNLEMIEKISKALGVKPSKLLEIAEKHDTTRF